MIQITIIYSFESSREALSDIEKKVQVALQKTVPFHDIFIFFFKPEVETYKYKLSIKIEIISQKGIQADEATKKLDITEKIIKIEKRKHNFKEIPMAICLTPYLSIRDVRWTN